MNEDDLGRSIGPENHCHACLNIVIGRHVETTISDSMKRKPDKTVRLHIECAKRHEMMPDDPP